MKPAVLLMLGASTVFGCSAANALTFNWTFQNTLGYPATGGIDSGTISVVGDGVYDISRADAGVTATFTGSTSGNSLSPEAWSSGGNSYGSITVFEGQITNYGFRFINSTSEFFGDKTYGAYVYDFSANNYDYTNQQNPLALSSAAAAAPAPLPILGLPAVLFYSRKLKKRIKASREASSASLV